MIKNLKDVDIVYHCAATAHEGLSVFSPNFITKNIYQASVSVITDKLITPLDSNLKNLKTLLIYTLKPMINGLFPHRLS